MEFTALDGGVAIVTLISGILAYARGFIREVLAIAAWVAAAVIAYYVAPQNAHLTAEIPVVGDFLKDSCGLRTIVAAAIVFVVALLVLSMFTPLFSGAVQRSSVGGVDQALGFLFGVARGLVLVAVALVIYQQTLGGEPIDMVQNSQTQKLFNSILQDVDQQIPTETPDWADTLFQDFMAGCQDPIIAPEATTPESDETATDQ